MQMIDITQYNPETMQLARPIYDRMKRVLLAEGRAIHPAILERIEDMGITTLIVKDAESEGISMDEMIDMPTWMDTITVVQKAFDLAAKKQMLNVAELQKSVAQMIGEVTKRKTIVLVPSSSVPPELKSYAHSVNVALLAIQTAKKLKYTQSQLRDLGIGSLLHDIGKAVSEEDEEHPQKGFELIKNQREISLLSAHIAYQHHELMNGKGYPRGLAGDDILELPQVCAVASLYENLISIDKMLPHEALELIMTKYETEYKGKVIEAFVNSIPSYYPGTKVILHNEQKAIVTKIKQHFHRPVIRLLEDQREIDLAVSPSIVIKEILVG
ncbi:HD domain-containing protein [Cytobacillus firmus]|uniref:HD-GYP domain-containing protein n=1 Tax=Cytobacillus firmus TaxID=1399 RepID=UPI002188E910|nr:HD domain-containing phosphohydrolase [Cytobacillus firmus]URM33489.1 HD domain-containing protein [Cytobacillus firmus]